MRWTVHGERWVYQSPWMSLRMIEVEPPGQARFEHHVMHIPREAAGVVVHDAERGLLLLWRHRFITDSWGWEIPAGAIDEGESGEAAGVRETLEETGWRPRNIRRLFSFYPANGASDQRFNIFVADGADRVGEPSDPTEAERVEWVPLDEVRRLIGRGEMTDGLSLTAVLWFLAIHVTQQA